MEKYNAHTLEDVEIFNKNTERILKEYEELMTNSNGLEEIYNSHPIFFTCIWLYIKNSDIGKPSFYFSDNSLILYQTFLEHKPDAFLVSWTKYFLNVNCYDIYDSENESITDGRKYDEIIKNCRNFYNKFLYPEIESLNKRFECFKINIEIMGDDYFHISYIERTFISYMFTPLMMKSYEKFFEKLSKQALIKINLGGHDNDEY